MHINFPLVSSLPGGEGEMYETALCNAFQGWLVEKSEIQPGWAELCLPQIHTLNP